MAGPAAPQISVSAYGKGVLISVDSNLPYQGGNSVKVFWREDGRSTERGTSTPLVYSNRFYFQHTSSMQWDGLVHVKVRVNGQGSDDDSPFSNEVAVTVNRNADDPATPDSPSMTVAGGRNSLILRFSNLAQDPFGPDFQYVSVARRDVPSVITQRLWQLADVATYFTGGSDFGQARFNVWTRTKTGSANWTAWAKQSAGDTGTNTTGTDDFEWTGQPEGQDGAEWFPSLSVQNLNSILLNLETYDVRPFGPDFVLNPTGTPTLSQVSFEPSGFQTNDLRTGSIMGCLVFRSRFGNHHYNVLLSADDDTWLWDGSILQAGQVQSWGSKNATLPDEVSLQQDADNFRPGRTGITIHHAARLVTHTQMGAAAPSDMSSSRRAVLQVVEDEEWGSLETATSASYVIDGLTDDQEYEVAAAVHSWTTGPYTTAVAEAGADGTAMPVVAAPVPAIGYDNIALPISVDSGQYVSEVTIDDGGSGYTSAPEVEFRPPGLDRRVNGGIVQGRAAQGTAVVSGGEVMEVNVTDGGSGFGDVVPKVTFIGGGGSGASATAVMSEHLEIENIKVEVRGTGIGPMAPTQWQTVRDDWRGDVMDKDGFEHGAMIDVRVTAKNANGETAATTSGLVVGFTEDAEEIFPGWFDRIPPGTDNLYRVLGTLWDRETGIKEWVATEPELVIDEALEELISQGVRRLRGLWVNGRQYAQGDAILHNVNVTIEGSHFNGLGEYTALVPHTADAGTRPTGQGNKTWALTQLPPQLADSAPAPTTGEDRSGAPPNYAVTLEYDKPVSENAGGTQPRADGEYKFGIGTGNAYVPSNYDWGRIMAHTTLAVAPRDKYGVSARLLWETLLYGVTRENNFEERVATVFADDRWMDSETTDGRVSANTERFVFHGAPLDKNESGGTDDIDADTGVEFRLRIRNIPVDADITNAALPLAVTGESATGGSGSIDLSWTLPDLGSTTRDDIVVGARLTTDERLGKTEVLDADATSHDFDGLEAGSYTAFIITRNAAGITTVSLSGITVT